jgi:hypothetical protein
MLAIAHEPNYCETCCRDYEKFLCASGEALVYAAMSRLMLRRLTRL